ncbi:MAG: adenylate/guanylate cyclase domain-containing protein, partial [Thermoplasmata archaeon]
ADIVDSTRLASRLGDHSWKETLDSFLAGSRTEIGRFRGQWVKTTGDGFLATFDGPTRAVRFAQAVRDQAKQRGLDLRAGLHTGECLMADNDVVGIAVHLASRICDSAGGGEVVTSRTVRDLSVGSEVRFEERGSRRFKGVEGTWETFLAVSR